MSVSCIILYYYYHNILHYMIIIIVDYGIMIILYYIILLLSYKMILLLSYYKIILLLSYYIGSVVAPVPFNICTNDQPITADTRSSIYADDLAITTQAQTFEKLKSKLEEALVDMSNYYTANCRRENTFKTQTCAFHLNNREAKRQLKIKWNNESFEHTNYPVYVGVTLDRTLNYKEHIAKRKPKFTLEIPSLANLLILDGGQAPRLRERENQWSGSMFFYS